MNKYMLFTLGFLAGCSDYEIIKRDVGDVFYQLEAGQVDILLVVDNSCSMDPYQEKLSQNFQSFLTYFIEGNIDYRIGVTTTTVSEPPPAGTMPGCDEAEVAAIPDVGYLVQNAVLDSSVQEAETIFENLVRVGTCGSGSEMGIESALQVLQNPSTGFLRDDAYLSVIFVSDEQDVSPLGVNSYINSMRSVKSPTARDVFNASSLVVNDIATCNAEQVSSGATVGSRYIDVAEQSNGIVQDICADDFAGIVTELSLRSSRLNDIFFLSQEPDPQSIILGVFDGESSDDDVSLEEGVPCDGSGEYQWYYERAGTGANAQPIIRFDRSKLPPPSSRITVQYDPGSGDVNAFCNGMYVDGNIDTGGAQ